MKYTKFIIENYRAIRGPLEIDLSTRIIPLIGINECGKTTILQAIYCFDYNNDNTYEGRHLRNTTNLYHPDKKQKPRITAEIEIASEKINSIIDQLIDEFHALNRNELESPVSPLASKVVSAVKSGNPLIINGKVVNVAKSSSPFVINGKVVNEAKSSSPPVINGSKVVNETKFVGDKVINSKFPVSSTITNDEDIGVRKQRRKNLGEIEELEKFKKSYSGKVLITRELTRESNGTNLKYLCHPLFLLSQDLQTKFCLKIVDLLPHIIYTDDFTDRPDGLVDIDPFGKHPPSDWKNIFEKVFRLAGNYSLFDTLTEQDTRIRKKTLSIVTNYLNRELTGSWSRFSSNSKGVETHLDIDQNSQLSITIVEKSEDGSDSYFEITDRSKGFIWYYNFIMKTMFNPKESGTKNETIFLLDEPGSYLHDKAQEDLCSKLKDISAKEGIVIYCTHSAKLLNPQIIPPNNIKIIEKEDNNIQAISLLDKNDTKSTRYSALQPLYEALEIPEYEMITQNDQIVCVEGIYDKYAIELFCLHLPSNIRLFPSTGSASIISNISYFITYCRPYIALWDNDPEGRKQLKEAKKYFGEVEAENFTTLPLMEKDKMRMEDMFEETDLINLRESLALPNVKYESLINALYFHKNKIDKQIIIESLSDKAKENFATLSEMLQKHFQIN